jgi:hypothetical protein
MKGGKGGRPRGTSTPKTAAPGPAARRGILPAVVVRVDPDAEVGGESKKARLRNAVKPKRGR